MVKLTTDACAPVVNFKGGLETLDDPECNLGTTNIIIFA